MNISQEALSSLTSLTGFRQDVIEKVVRLMSLLNTINSHTFLKGKLALKGGTALNVFIFEFPRLSVDIDLNYIGAIDRDEMLAEKPKIEQALQAVFSREDYNIKRVPTEHAGGKWRLGYQNAAGRPGNLEIDLNFMLRQPLLKVKKLNSYSLGDFTVQSFPVLDFHELMAGKLAALFSRRQARDLFDVYELLSLPDIEKKLLRMTFIVYGAMNRKDWRTISLDDIIFNSVELDRMLLPVLNKKISQKISSLPSFGENLVDQCRKKLSIVFPFSESELKFLNAILDHGEIKPDLITEDPKFQNCISNHPMLKWKALNVRKHFNLD
jgi:predicted nucleotidyltransferase component of viral defense system